MENLGGPVPRDYPHYDPTAAVNPLQPANIPGVLTPIVAMLFTVVLDRDFDILPTHIEVSNHIAELVVNGDLSLWTRQTGLYQDQP